MTSSSIGSDSIGIQYCIIMVHGPWFILLENFKILKIFQHMELLLSFYHWILYCDMGGVIGYHYIIHILLDGSFGTQLTFFNLKLQNCTFNATYTLKIYCTLNQNLMLASILLVIPQNQPLVHGEKATWKNNTTKAFWTLISFFIKTRTLHCFVKMSIYEPIQNVYGNVNLFCFSIDTH